MFAKIKYTFKCRESSSNALYLIMGFNGATAALALGFNSAGKFSMNNIMVFICILIITGTLMGMFMLKRK
ncbi:hypothetical protein FZI27_20225 [Cronobacter sakazakii]|nr:hypothetical protein FZI27_20225 [Cronobacter sakazakii]